MKKLFIYAGALAFFISSCTKDISSFNDNVKAPTAVPATTLFANATKELTDYIASPNVNVNTFRLWAQHWTQTTYTDESNYELVERNINGEVWDRMYARVLRDIKEARMTVEADEVLADNEKNTQLAMLDVLEAYAYSSLVDIFGDVPYSEALMGVENLSPAYDDGYTVYKTMADKLTAAMSTFDGGSAGEFASADLIYGGDVSMWKMFAASLKLRMAMRIADSDGATAKTWAESAMSHAFTSNADNAILVYQTSTPNTNPLWEDLVQSGRTDFIASNTLADIMNANSDPRRDEYFRNLDSLGNVTGNPHGAGGAYSDYSQPGDMMEDPTHPGMLLTYAEVEFHMADAANRGWATSGSAQEHYEAAVTASIEQWGGDATEAATYLGGADVAWDAAKADELIGTQKWIAMFDQGLEAWSTWRMYDYPAMNIATEAGTIPPYRYNYGVDEYSVNGTNVSAANGGSDKLTDKVFWDVD